VARENGVKSIAFPSISTGAYGYPIDEAAPIALNTVCDFILSEQQLEVVRFVLFNEPILAQYSTALALIVAQRAEKLMVV
jgi:O-acetyl-ADP-ribose deacetylase (regulator of RNase III)